MLINNFTSFSAKIFAHLQNKALYRVYNNNLWEFENKISK